MPEVARVFAAIIREGAIVMLYVDHRTHAHWTLPGGRVDPGETPEEAVIREVWEETGLRGERPVPLFDREWEPGRVERCFLLEISSDQEPVLGRDPELERQELALVAWRPLDDVRGDRNVARVLEALKYRDVEPGIRPARGRVPEA